MDKTSDAQANDGIKALEERAQRAENALKREHKHILLRAFAAFYIGIFFTGGMWRVFDYIDEQSSGIKFKQLDSPPPSAALLPLVDHSCTYANIGNQVIGRDGATLLYCGGAGWEILHGAGWPTCDRAIKGIVYHGYTAHWMCDGDLWQVVR